MKGLTIAKQLVVALVLTALSLPLLVIGRGLGVPALPFMFSAITVGYLALVVSQGWQKPGKSVLIGAVAAMCVVGFLGSSTLGGFVLVLAATVWVVRSLVSYERASGWVFDGALVYGGLVAGAWVLGCTGATFLALWTFFLIQSLYPIATARKNPVSHTNDPFARFEQSSRAAEEALRRVVAVRA